MPLSPLRISLERVVDMTEAYWGPKLAKIKAKKDKARRVKEDAVFEKALAELK